MTMAFEEVAGLLLGSSGRVARPVSPLEIVERIQSGLPLAALDRVAQRVAPDDASFKYRIVPPATLARRKKQREKLSAAEGDRLVRLAKVWEIARDVWGSEEEARAFLFRPHMMLEGRRPVYLVLATDLGARLVEDILGRLKYGSAA